MNLGVLDVSVSAAPRPCQRSGKPQVRSGKPQVHTAGTIRIAPTPSFDTSLPPCVRPILHQCIPVMFKYCHPSPWSVLKTSTRHVALLQFPVLLQPKPIVQAAAPKGMVDLEATEVINKGKLQVAVAVFARVSLVKYQRKHLDRCEILARCQQSENDILHDALFGSELFDEKAMTIVACSAVSSMHHVKPLIVIQRREIDRLRSLAESQREEAQHVHASLHESKECSSMPTVLASVVTSFALKSQSLVRMQRWDLESRLQNNTLQQKNISMQEQILASTAEVSQT